MFERIPLLAESWNIAFRCSPAGTILTDTNTPFSVIPNSFRYWAADPFPVEYEGNLYVFAELYDYIRCRGIIGYCKIVDGKPGKWIPVIVEDTHLSYPCPIIWNDRIYLMPETGESESLCVYESVEFPDKWRKHTILRKNVHFVDTSPLPESTLALTHDVSNPTEPKLLLIDLTGIELDVKVLDYDTLCSRPGGNPFLYKGELIRPVQCSYDFNQGYGKNLVFFRGILEEGCYTEKPFKEVLPQNLKYNCEIYLDGMHTYNATEHYEVIDIKTRRFNLLNLLMRFVSKILHN